MKRAVGTVAALLLVLSGLVLAAPRAGAAAPRYAPVDAPGPALTVPLAQLRASLHCTANVAHATREPVLLTPATTVDSDQNYAYGYEGLFRQQGIPYCTSDSPIDPYNMGDMQVRAQFVTYDIRAMHALAGRKIAVMGHSQGGMIMRWSLRFWPDTRAMVDDVVGVAGTNHGSALVPALCVPDCAASLWQQRDDSAFVAALNSGQETFPGISYTEIYTRTDEFVQPNLDATGVSSLHGGGGAITNVAVQDVCPTDAPEHLAIGTIDPVSAAIALDALDHAGPAVPARVDRAACTEGTVPGTPVATQLADFALASRQVVEQLSFAAKRIPAEPPLACYVTASCPTR